MFGIIEKSKKIIKSIKSILDTGNAYGINLDNLTLSERIKFIESYYNVEWDFWDGNHNMRRPFNGKQLVLFHKSTTEMERLLYLVENFMLPNISEEMNEMRRKNNGIFPEI